MAVTVQFTILGQPFSKANRRRMVVIADKPSLIKSKEALAYERDALMQIPPAARLRIEGDVMVLLRIYYASRRPDLDESVVLDVLQDRWSKAKVDKMTGREYIPRQLVQAGVYRNDRQVREKHVYWGLDQANPRVEIIVQALQAQQQELIEPVPAGARPRWDDKLDPSTVPF